MLLLPPRGKATGSHGKPEDSSCPPSPQLVVSSSLVHPSNISDIHPHRFENATLAPLLEPVYAQCGSATGYFALRFPFHHAQLMITGLVCFARNGRARRVQSPPSSQPPAPLHSG